MRIDPLSLGFVAIVVLLGGAIALVADRTGRILGKKRLSLFGMRPRRTAEVITVAAGVLIPFVTLGLIMAASSEVRTWIIEGRRAIEESRKLQAELDRMQERRRLASAREQELDTRLKETEKRVGVLISREKTAKEMAAKAQTEITRIDLQRRQLESSYSKASGQLAQVRRDLNAKRAEQVRLQGKLEDLGKSYTTLSDLRQEAEEQNLKLMSDIRKLEADEATMKKRVDNLGKEVSDKQTELADAQEKLSRVIVDYQEQIGKAVEEQRRLEDALSRARQDLSIAENQVIRNIGETRTKPLTFSRGDELARLQIEANVDEQRAEQALRLVLANARLAASQRGAKPDESGHEAGIVAYTDRNGVQRTVALQEEELVKAIVKRPQEAVLLARAPFNVFLEEFVPLRVDVLDNPVVYRAGDVIAEGRIDAGQADEGIFQQVTRFLQDQVGKKAMEDKMIPMAGSSAVFGEVTADQILGLVRELRVYNRLVRVAAIAENQTRAADRLRLEFRIR